MWFGTPWDWFKAEARGIWPYVLLALVVALLIIGGWFGYHVYYGRLE